MSSSGGIKPIDRFLHAFPDIAAALKSQGWECSVAHSGHLKFRGPNGQTCVGSGTPSRSSAHRLLVKELKAAGLDLSVSAIKKVTPQVTRVVNAPDDYIMPEEYELRNPTLGVTVHEERPFGFGEAWTTGQVAEFLGATAKEVAEWRDAGYLEECAKPEGRRGPGRYFWNLDVRVFQTTEEFQTLHKEHRKRPPKAEAIVKSVPIEAIRMVVARRSMEECTLEELAEALGKEIFKAVLKEVKGYLNDKT